MTPQPQQKALPCVACGMHFFPENRGDQICESSECAQRVQQWAARSEKGGL